jgi:hypothetical protein
MATEGRIEIEVGFQRRWKTAFGSHEEGIVLRKNKELDVINSRQPRT